MEQRAKAAGKSSAAAVYRKFIEQQKKKTAAKNEAVGNKTNLFLDRPSKSRGYTSGEDKTWMGDSTSEHIYKYLKDMGLVENQRESKMKITRRQLRRIISESMKALHGDIQNEILALGQEQGGELVVQDVVDYLSGYANDPMGDPRAEYVGAIEYDEALQIMFDMVDAGMLTGGYEDFFDVHPDYM